MSLMSCHIQTEKDRDMRFFFHWLAKSIKISFHLKILKIGQREAEICQKMSKITQNQTFCFHSQL